MNNEMIELARRAVASPHWRWMPGMRLVCPGSDEAFRVESEPAWNGGLYRAFGISEDWIAAPEDELPDLTDPATLGWLLALVREAWGCEVWVSLDPDPDPVNGAMCGDEHWFVSRVGFGLSAQRIAHGTDAASALVAALESAPRQA